VNGFTTRPEIRGTFGVVASTHWLASAAGMGVLERGGNAFDAAAAAGFVLQVVEPHLNGPGGDMPALLWSRKSEKVEVVCGQGPAPAGASIEKYRSLGLELIPGTGLLACCIPGTFEAWMRILRDHGTWRLGDVMEAAIGYAENGFPAVARIRQAIDTVRPLFEAEWTTSAAQWLPAPKPGQLMRNRKLAATWRRLLEESRGGTREAEIEKARKAWRQGFVAEAIDRFCRTQELMDASGRRNRGVLTGDDMARFEATVEAPLTIDYRGWTVAKCSWWTQGPVLLQLLRLLDGFDVGAMDSTGSDFVHTFVECAKLAYADREAWYGDPKFADVPGELLSPAYAAERRRLVGREASLELRPGSPDGRAPRLPTPPRGDAFAAGIGEPTIGTGEPTVARLGISGADTVHIDVIDRWGNMLSATPSGGWLQSSPTIPELGFCLGTRAQMFWLEEGLPLSLAPGKRPRSTLSPSMALHDGKPTLAWGTPGGDQQDQWSALLFLHRVQHGMNLQEAIDCPAFHSEHWTSSFFPRGSKPGHLAVEGRFPSATIEELKRRGHRVAVGEDWSEGRLSAAEIERTEAGDILKAAANPRGMQGYAVGR
jgi:gamma-glutamyltranspeptidase/glutathione hydrolase